jgi:hypothetical protein
LKTSSDKIKTQMLYFTFVQMLTTMFADSGLLIAREEIELLKCRRKWFALHATESGTEELLPIDVILWLSTDIVESLGSSIRPPAVKLIKCTSWRMSFRPIACKPLGRLQMLPLKIIHKTSV